MAIRINSIVTEWSEWFPLDTTAATIIDFATETRFQWGTPTYTAGLPSYIALRGNIPPIRVVTEGNSFRLVRLRYSNSRVSGTKPTAVTATITISIDGEDDDTLELTFTNSASIASSTLSFSDALPREFTLAGRTFKILGFQQAGQGISDTVTLAVGESADIFVIANFVSDIETEVTGDAVFAPAGCEVPYIPPIIDEPFLLDCTLPEDIQAITDCPEIDIPGVSAVGMQVLVGEMGPPGPPGDDGPPGPPGQDGQDGCDPRVTVSSQYKCVRTVAEVKVNIVVAQVEACWTHVHFIFFVYCPVAAGGSCSAWIWCPCPDNYTTTYDGGYQDTPTDNGCPKTDTCGAAPGYWVLASSGGAHNDPPCITGSYYGQMEFKCDCPEDSSSSSSSSSSENSHSGNCCCPDVALPSRLYLDLDTDNCPLMECDDLVLDIAANNCYEGSNGTYNYQFCCVDFDPCVWQLRISGFEGSCYVALTGDEESCSPFYWQQTTVAAGGGPECCGGPSPGSITATVSQFAM